VLKNIPLQNIVLVQYPSKTGGTGIFAGKVQPITSVANALFDAIKADVPIGLDENSLEGAHGGSTLDPNAPVATEAPVDPSATPTIAPETPEATLVPGVKGQSAAQYTCSVSNS